MPRVREARLARLATAATRTDSAEALDRCALEGWTNVDRIVRDCLTQSGIDPERASALRLSEAATARLSRLPEKPELPPPDKQFAAAENDALAGAFAAKIGDMVRIYREQPPCDFGLTSMAELFAWCLSRRAE